MENYTFKSIMSRTAIVHTVTYFVMGILALAFLGYSDIFADPAVEGFMRPTDSPWVAIGPLLNVIRGLLFGIVFYLLRETIFPRRSGWLILWVVLVIVGILSPFGAAPSSIEGMIYTNLPLWFHITGLPEVLIQALLLAVLTHLWVNHPDWKSLDIAFGLIFILVIVFSVLGLLAGLGFLVVPDGFTF